MGDDPYGSGKVKKDIYAAKTAVAGTLVAVLRGGMADRGLQLIAPASRALRRDAIHELIMTDEENARPNQPVNSIAYIGFFRVDDGGVIVVQDEVYLDGHLIGHVAGYDDTHMPNHQNVVIRAANKQSGVELGAQLGMKIVFQTTRKEV